jgi:hypothetical protein
MILEVEVDFSLPQKDPQNSSHRKRKLDVLEEAGLSPKNPVIVYIVIRRV